MRKSPERIAQNIEKRAKDAREQVERRYRAGDCIPPLHEMRKWARAEVDAIRHGLREEAIYPRTLDTSRLKKTDRL